jgi:hypothetical protein
MEWTLYTLHSICPQNNVNIFLLVVQTVPNVYDVGAVEL